MIPLAKHRILSSADPSEAFASIKNRQPGLFRFIPKQKRGNDWNITINFTQIGSIRVTSTKSSGYSVEAAPDGFFRLFISMGSSFYLKRGLESREFPRGKSGLMPRSESTAFFDDGFSAVLMVCPEDELAQALVDLDCSASLSHLQNELFGCEALNLARFQTRFLAFLEILEQTPSSIVAKDRFARTYNELIILNLAESLMQESSLNLTTTTSPSVKRAVTYIQEYFDSDIELRTLAAAAGCSVRNLQILFKSQLNTKITTYINGVRLARAHDMLSTPEPGSTVSSIALSCGFSHLSLFAAAYRVRYGQLPSRTLANHRSQT